MDKSLNLKGLSKNAKDGGPRPPEESPAALAAAQVAIGVFGAAVVLIYPVGFFTLWLEMMDSYGYNSNEALYAASLVPSSVVAGQAIFVLAAISRVVVLVPT